MSEILWGSEKDEILIDFVKKHEILYNPFLKGYRKAQLKQKLWKEIGEILDKSDIECCKRWTYVRDYYVKRKRKPGPSSGEAARKRSKLLSFVDNYTLENPSNIPISAIYSAESTKTEEIDSEQTIMLVNSYSVEDIDDFRDGCNNVQNNEAASKEEEKDNGCGSKEQTIEVSVRPQKVIKAASSHSEELLQRQTPQRQSLPEDADETDLFFASMLKIVKKLPKCEQVQLRMQIGNLVGNAELKYWSSQEKT